MLPGIDGFKVARKLREDDRTREVAMIALTALRSAKFEQMALAAGCDSFLSKPVIAAALIGELVRLIARRSQQASDASAPDLTRVKGG
jgi:CheY-like chemotaxis protein